MYSFMVVTLNYRRIELVSELPAGWELIHIRGSSIGSWQGKAGIILVEQVSISIYSIIVVRVFFQSPERIELRMDKTQCSFSYCMEGQWQIVDQSHSAVIKPNQYQLFFSDSLQCIPLPVTGRMNQLLMVTKKINSHSLPSERLQQPFIASASMIDLVLQLTQTSYFPQPRQFHENLLQKIFKITEEDITKGKFSSERFASSEIEALYKVSILIESDLKRYHNIASLAVYSGMNRQKLTTGFKSLFGQTIYGYYLSRRMDLAKTLLITSDLPLKLVAKKAGYKSATNFSIAFKKFYNLTPAQMRRIKPD